jgi:hypothetical protein
MTVVSSKEFVSNQKRYFDLALNEQVFIKRGKNMFHIAYNPMSEPRQGWAEAAKKFVETGNEDTFFSDFFEDEDLSWWQWEQK